MLATGEFFLCIFLKITQIGNSIEMYQDSIDRYSYPNGSYWKDEHPALVNKSQEGRRMIG